MMMMAGGASAPRPSGQQAFLTGEGAAWRRLPVAIPTLSDSWC